MALAMTSRGLDAYEGSPDPGPGSLRAEATASPAAPSSLGGPGAQPRADGSAQRVTE